jgi:transposase
MEITTLSDWLNKLLKVEDPWQILKIEHQEKLSVVDIYLGFKRGSTFACPDCKTLCKVHDCKEHRIRHLDCFNYRSYLNVKVPRVKCATHGVKVIEQLPWGHTGKHYSFFLNS